MSTYNQPNQVDIFADTDKHLHFSMLCNALYERELSTLSSLKNQNISLLQRKLAGLNYHIKRAAEEFLSSQGPMRVDVHNASWQSKQAAKCMQAKTTPEQTQEWLASNRRHGLTLPVYVSHFGEECFELDSVDQFDAETGKVHVNKHGWFSLNGEDLSPCEKSGKGIFRKRLLKPNKAVMSAACSGHTWDHRGRSQPRTLSLRELRLCSTIDWKRFK